MPVQQQMSSFAKKMGARVAQANQEHKDKPVDVGMQRLPAGIRNGVAKLSAMYTKEYADDKQGVKGQTFFRASAVTLIPKQHNGEKVEGMVTSQVVPLCDMPAKGQRKATSFNENWFDFQNIFKLLGVAAPNETPQSDPTGARTEAYYFAAMKTLCDPQRPPVYISFSTRGWTPPKTQLQPNPQEMVFETWHGLATEEQIAELSNHDPASGVTEPPGLNGVAQPDPHSLPPTNVVAEQPPFNEFAGGNTSMPTDLADQVAVLVETAMNDPEGATEDGSQASAKLEELAWAVGWSKEQTAGAADWTVVGDMALNAPPANAPRPAAAPLTQVVTPTQTHISSTPTVGSKFKFAKRTKDGSKLKNAQGIEFPPQEVEVSTVDAAAKTCTVKSVKDGKDVVDIRSKKPVEVKFEWLE